LFWDGCDGAYEQAALRQMVYLVIKELSTIAEDVIMVTSSIMKDMQPNLEVVYRPNAIRALARIIDVRLGFPAMLLCRASQQS
jgi:coatomer protein complex subunit gamma